MKCIDYFGPCLMVALLAVPGSMAIRTFPISEAAAFTDCAATTAKLFNVPVGLLRAIDHVEFGGEKYGQPCMRYAGEAKAMANIMAKTGGDYERVLANFYAGDSGLRAYDANKAGPHSAASKKVMEKVLSQTSK